MLSGYNDQENDTRVCGMCKIPLNMFCPTCRSNLGERIKFIRRMKPIWMTLLLAQQHHGCIWNMLDIPMVAKIFDLVLRNEYPLNCDECFLVQLECGHVYHYHCITSRFSTSLGTFLTPCPFDHLPIICKDLFPQTRRIALGTCRVFVDDNSKEVTNLIVKFLSRKRGRRSMQSICNACMHYDPAKVKRVLKYLVEQGIVHTNDGDFHGLVQ